MVVLLRDSDREFAEQNGLDSRGQRRVFQAIELCVK
jgi:hypothetical protein